MTSEKRLLSVSEQARQTTEAAHRVRPYIIRTPLTLSSPLSQETSVKVYLKLENEQVSGSVKARGMFNKAVLLHDEGIKHACFTSTGNNALAACKAFSTLGINGTVFMAALTDEEKKTRVKREGMTVIEYDTNHKGMKTSALPETLKSDAVYIYPSYDYQITTGLGTVAKEIIEDLPDVDAVFVTVGSGAIITGVSAYIKTHRPSCKVVGCSAYNSRMMYESVCAGHPVQIETKYTLSDASRTSSIQDDSVTLPMCQDFVDEWVLVDEEQIAEAVYFCLKEHKKVVEGSAGVALAAFKKSSAAYKGKKVVVLICGGNISITNIQKIINTHTKHE